MYLGLYIENILLALDIEHECVYVYIYMICIYLHLSLFGFQSFKLDNMWDIFGICQFGSGEMLGRS